MIKIKSQKFGFTLAEVLITLGIIGVIAAMTVPNLMSKISKKQVEIQAKAAYSTIAQAMKFSEYEETSAMPVAANNVASMKQWFDTFLAPHLKVENICFQQPGCWHKKGAVKTLNNTEPSFETAVGLNDSTLGWATVTFRTSKGVYFNLDGSSVGTTASLFGVDVPSQSMQFYFDVNGDRKPNVIGKDIYIMVYNESVGLVPAGHSRSIAQVDNNCLNGNGYWCLSKLKREGWVISDRVWKRKR